MTDVGRTRRQWKQPMLRSPFQHHHHPNVIIPYMRNASVRWIRYLACANVAAVLPYTKDKFQLISVVQVRSTFIRLNACAILIHGRKRCGHVFHVSGKRHPILFICYIRWKIDTTGSKNNFELSNRLFFRQHMEKTNVYRMCERTRPLPNAFHCIIRQQWCATATTCRRQRTTVRYLFLSRRV